MPPVRAEREPGQERRGSGAANRNKVHKRTAQRMGELDRNLSVTSAAFIT